MKAFFRKNILEMNGYTPGEQPKKQGIIKLNTNENPFPPSPKIKKFLTNFDISKLRLYPDPLCSELRELIAKKFKVKPSNVIVGNGSDDILNIITRCCSDEINPISYFEPSYSLYSVLAKIQAAKCIPIPLEKDFSIPKNIPDEIFKAKLIFITRPNAPSGNNFPKNIIKKICLKAKGIVLIDEAYADFAEDNCIDIAINMDNVIVCRTLSKSYSLAGIRLGFAIASENIISQMMKVKDSYNVCKLTQEIAKIAITDEVYFKKNIKKIIKNRTKLTNDLKDLNFKVIESQTNFLFTSPPEHYKMNAEQIYNYLKNNGIFVRHFKGKTTENYLRITVGTEEENKKLIDKLRLIQ